MGNPFIIFFVSCTLKLKQELWDRIEWSKSENYPAYFLPYMLMRAV